MKPRTENIRRLDILRYWFNEGKKAARGERIAPPARKTNEYEQFKKGIENEQGKLNFKID